MTKQDWIDVKAEGDALLAALAQAKRDGLQPGLAQFVRAIVVGSVVASIEA
jgi:hypothetical protein